MILDRRVRLSLPSKEEAELDEVNECNKQSWW